MLLDRLSRFKRMWLAGVALLVLLGVLAMRLAADTHTAVAAPAAPEIFASPVHAGCYLAKADRCKIHVEPFTINIVSGKKLAQFQLSGDSHGRWHSDRRLRLAAGSIQSSAGHRHDVYTFRGRQRLCRPVWRDLRDQPAGQGHWRYQRVQSWPDQSVYLPYWHLYELSAGDQTLRAKHVRQSSHREDIRYFEAIGLQPDRRRIALRSSGKRKQVVDDFSGAFWYDQT